MPGATLPCSLKRLLSIVAPLLALVGCSASQPPPRVSRAEIPRLYTPPPSFSPTPVQARTPRVMLGIDVLQAENFAPLRGKRIGLLTHAAGVNRYGVSTIDILRHAPGVKLVALYGVEHGVYNNLSAEKPYGDYRDPRTGLMVYSLYNGHSHEPTPAQLRPIDALVIDLQDIGTRSYTFISAMKLAMQGCFKAGKEVIVLDRPDPLGGLKVDGPMLNPRLVSYVGEFPVPYVYGLTIGELARMAKDLRPPSPFALQIPDRVRERGKLLVIPMRGWTRSMRWPETGLRWVPTSPMMPDFGAVEGYPMVGLGTYSDPPRIEIGFHHGVGRYYPFRGLSHRTARLQVIQRELTGYHLPGLQYRIVSAPGYNARPAYGLYVEITDYDAWRPTELNFYLMKMACQLDGYNPFLPAPGRDFSGFLHVMGSESFLYALRRYGARINLQPWLQKWREQDHYFQIESRKYWLYR